MTVLLSFEEKKDDARACAQSGHCPFNTLSTRLQKDFPLCVFVFIDSFVVCASQDAGGHTLSRQNNVTFGIG